MLISTTLLDPITVQEHPKLEFQSTLLDPITAVCVYYLFTLVILMSKQRKPFQGMDPDISAWWDEMKKMVELLSCELSIPMDKPPICHFSHNQARLQSNCDRLHHEFTSKVRLRFRRTAMVDLFCYVWRRIVVPFRRTQPVR